MCTVVQELYSTKVLQEVQYLFYVHNILRTVRVATYVKYFRTKVRKYESTFVRKYESTSVRCMILGGNRIGQGPTSASLSHGTIE